MSASNVTAGSYARRTAVQMLSGAEVAFDDFFFFATQNLSIAKGKIPDG
ncbi:hypothetical protein [Cupriavidus alkaliphilus]|nr:hypothetical protein [Cupriavidus alkaliphilus]MBB2920098.1 hypothetical protein [Cupriavidus alkaliphilus]